MMEYWIYFTIATGWFVLVDAVIPTREQEFRSYNLEYFNRSASYDDAKLACEDRGSWIVETKDVDIESTLKRLVGSSVTVWIGLKNSNGVWKWGDNEPLRYSNWMQSSSDGQCASLTAGGWEKTLCAEKHHYVCQSDVNYLPYKLTYEHTNRKNFTQAKLSCKNNHQAHLVNIKTKSLNKAIFSVVSEHDNPGEGQANMDWYLTSGNDIINEGTFVWGDNTTVDLWEKDTWYQWPEEPEPNGKTRENCLAVPAEWGGWIDADCTLKNSYICQKEFEAGESCVKNLCNNHGQCGTIKLRYNCTCDGYFGTKCEKELIAIATDTPNIEVFKGLVAYADVRVTSYDGDMIISHNRNGNRYNQTVTFTKPGENKSVKVSLGVQVFNATYQLTFAPLTRSYSRRTIVNVKVKDQCSLLSPCQHDGTCTYSTESPYYNCTCYGYFGTKCEKELIAIATDTPNIEVFKGLVAYADVRVTSYDGDMIISHNRNGNRYNQTVKFTKPGENKLEKVSLGVQVSDATYQLTFAPLTRSYSGETIVNVKVKDQCSVLSPCQHDGTCTYSTKSPYYNCSCSPEYTGQNCTERKFARKENCTYYATYDIQQRKTFDSAKTECSNLGGVLAMPKTRDIQDKIEQQFLDQYGESNKTTEIWVGGKNDSFTWYWMDNTTMDITDSRWIQSYRDYMIMSTYKTKNMTDMFWYSKLESKKIAGFACEVAETSPCQSKFCSNGGTCEATGCQGNCKCALGFYGETCETDSIKIVALQKHYDIFKDEEVTVNLNIISNDGAVVVELYETESKILDTKTVAEDSVTFTFSPTTYQHNSNVSFTFRARPNISSFGEYHKDAHIYVFMKDQCKLLSPCQNGTCTFAAVSPFYKCSCVPEYDGVNCTDRRFAQNGNCKYYATYSTKQSNTFDAANTKCTALGGVLAMPKTSDIQDVIEQQFIDQYGERKEASTEVWIGGKKESSTWYWMDNALISLNDPRWRNKNLAYMVMSSYHTKNMSEMLWYSKVTLHGLPGFACEVAATDQCQSITCLNNGSCKSVGCQENCKCIAGFYGQRCEKDSIIIVPDQQYYTVLQGDEVTIRLNITSVDGPVVIDLYRKKSEILQTKTSDVDAVTFTFSPAAKLLGNTTYTFRARPNMSSNGNYDKYAYVKVAIEAPPSVTLSRMKFALPVTSVEKNSITCSVTGFPQPTLKWLFKGASVPGDNTKPVYQSISGDKSILHFSAGAREQVGNYTCEGENVVLGQKQKNNATAFVRGRILLTDNSSEIAESVNKNTTLSCTFEGYPKINTFWKLVNGKEEKALLSNDTLISKDTRSGNRETLFQETSTITIRLTEYLGNITLICYAENEFGNKKGLSFHLNKNSVIVGDRSYRIYNDIHKDYEKAQAYCQANNRNLAKITDNGQFDAIAAHTTRSDPVFLGGQRHTTGENKRWKWQDESVFYDETKHGRYAKATPGFVDGNFVAWSSDQPNLGDCVRMDNIQWNSSSCDINSGFVCESQVGGVPKNLEISVDECTTDIVVSWTTSDLARGVQHRIEIRVADFSNDEANVTSQRSPTGDKKSTKRIKNLKQDTMYNVKFLVCPSCSRGYSTDQNVTTYRLLKPENAIFNSSTIERVEKSCTTKWSMETLKGINGFQIEIVEEIAALISKSQVNNEKLKRENVTLETTEHTFETLPNRKYKFYISAITCLGIGPQKLASGTCIAESEAPTTVPKSVVNEKVNDDWTMDIQVGIPDQSNGPISCIFVILTYKTRNEEIEYDMEKLRKAMSNAESDTLSERDYYIAIAIPRSKFVEITTLAEKLGDETVSSCDISSLNTGRKKRSVTSEEIQGNNRELEADIQYSYITVTTTPGENEIHMQSSGVSSFKTPKTSSTGLIVGLVAAVVVLLLIAGVVAFVVVQRKKQKTPNSENVSMNEIENQDRTYANLGQLGPISENPESETLVPLTQLQMVYSDLLANDNKTFLEQFTKIKEETKKLDYPTEVATNPVLRKKNRYKNIIPSDKSRVSLQSGGAEFGYINACYINGFRKAKKFIATQGPLPATVCDFWQMIYEQKSSTIVMLTKCIENGKTKCEKYWPDLGLVANYNEISVYNLEESNYGSFKVTMLKVSKGKENLTVYHCHFLYWPDHGVPVATSNLIRFYLAVKGYARSGPIITHCSAGAGRTGAFIAYDFLLQEAETYGSIDPYSCVMKLREQRTEMVQNCTQYILVHKLLLEHHLLGDTDRDGSKTFEIMDSDRTIADEFEKISLVPPIGQQLYGTEECHRSLNRDQNIVPYERNKVIIVMNSNDEQSPYINASILETYDSARKIIATQGPLASTVEHFWRAVMDNKVNTIVMLTECTENNIEQSTQYWPDAGLGDLNLKSLQVKCRSENKSGQIVERELEVVRDKEKATIIQYQYTHWSSFHCPSNPTEVLDLVEKMHASVRRHKDAAALIHCSNGSGRTGAFCAIVNLLDRLKTENKIDVFRAVKDLRDCRPQMVESLQQYRFCYEAVCGYLSSFSLYSNFDIKRKQTKEENVYQNL